MTRAQRTEKLQHAYTLSKLSHRGQGRAWALLNEQVTRTLRAENRAYRKALKGAGQ